uniref:Uncharacterized protein n=1 Tax=Panagrolaimus davidi TaxID=227884 RepID=A0A914QWK1_9BILA
METYFGKEITENELKAELKSMEPNEVKPAIPDYAIDETGFAPFRTTKALPLKMYEKQTFAFPSKLLFYILQKSDSKMLQKLYSSSKQLYLITKIPICHRLEINEFDSTVSFEQSLFISVNGIQIGNAEMLFLTNSLVLSSGNRNLLTEFIPKIYKCDKNAAPNSRFYIEFKAPREYVENLDDLIKMEFNKWVPENEKPCIIITKEIVLGRI